ncbi:DUF4129 domain-containing protein, partial [Luoshenia tenuis]|uniref:DUF4129 domain-containing protein n=1 Tax=Luoshenia tenuis TaxID=2763654 RepID=UPI003D8F564C
AVLVLLALLAGSFIVAFFPWMGVQLQTVWMVAAPVAAAAGFFVARTDIPSTLDVRLLPVGFGLYLVVALVFGWLFPMPGAGERLGAFGSVYVVIAVLMINATSVREAGAGNAPRSVRRGGRMMVVPVIILALLMMNGPLVGRGLQGFLWMIAQVVGFFVAGLGWIMSLFAQNTPEGLTPATPESLELEPTVETPQWLQIVMWMVAALIVAFILFMAVRWVIRALKRLMERTAPSGRYSQGEGYVDEEEDIVQTKRRGWLSRMLRRMRRKGWKDCADDTERVRLAYRRVLDHLEEQEAQNPLTLLTPNELAGQAQLRRVPKGTLQALAQGYNLARYSRRAPDKEHVEAARKVYGQL